MTKINYKSGFEFHKKVKAPTNPDAYARVTSAILAAANAKRITIASA